MRVKPVFTRNSLKRLWGWVGGVEQHHPEGAYLLRYRNTTGRRCWETVGKSATAALAARTRKERELNARQDAALAGLNINDDHTERIRVADAIALYVDDAKNQKATRTFGERRYALEMFQRNCTKTYIDQLDKDDIRQFINFLRQQRPVLSDRTVYNRVCVLRGFLRANCNDELLKRKDLPRYTEKRVTAYTEDELRALFAAAKPNERLLFQFLLYSGAREGEVAHAAWSDVNSRDKTFAVTEKRDMGFTPKDKEERLVPIPDSLLRSLKEWRTKNVGARLIFPNRLGGADGHFLRRLKNLALRAGLNCGDCINKVGQSCAEHPVCDRWELHKFRRTFATMHHESGVSARTLQAWLGHSSLETTLAYLKVADLRSERTRAQVNNTFAQFSQPNAAATPAVG